MTLYHARSPLLYVNQDRFVTETHLNKDAAVSVNHIRPLYGIAGPPYTDSKVYSNRIDDYDRHQKRQHNGSWTSKFVPAQDVYANHKDGLSKKRLQHNNISNKKNNLNYYEKFNDNIADASANVEDNISNDYNNNSSNNSPPVYDNSNVGHSNSFGNHSNDIGTGNDNYNHHHHNYNYYRYNNKFPHNMSKNQLNLAILKRRKYHQYLNPHQLYANQFTRYKPTISNEGFIRKYRLPPTPMLKPDSVGYLGSSSRAERRMGLLNKLKDLEGQIELVKNKMDMMDETDNNYISNNTVTTNNRDNNGHNNNNSTSNDDHNSVNAMKPFTTLMGLEDTVYKTGTEFPYRKIQRQEAIYGATILYKRALYLSIMGAALYTMSPLIFIVALAIGVMVEMIMSITIARSDYLEFINTYSMMRRSNGLTSAEIYNYDWSNWRYVLGLSPDLWLNEEEDEIEDIETKEDSKDYQTP